jgi:F-type H+-transporting ATPase subunit delta
VHGAVAKRYAMALFELAVETGRLREIDDQAKMLRPLFAERRLKDFLLSPRIPAADKKRVLDSVLGARIDRVLLNLLKLLVDKRRMAYMPDIMRHYDILTDQRLGVEEVTVVSAVPLTDEQRSQIIARVKRFSSYGELRERYEVDSGVLGGVKVRLGENLVLDGTLSSRIRQMRERLYRYRHRGVGA